jgi:hypothetical protein
LTEQAFSALPPVCIRPPGTGVAQIVEEGLAVRRIVRALADDVTVMKSDRVVEKGPALEVLRRPRQPYTRALMAAAFTSRQWRTAPSGPEPRRPGDPPHRPSKKTIW